MKRIYIYLLYICTCVKNGSKNSYRYGRSARIFTPPHSPLPLPPPPRRRGRSTREQLAKNGGLAWKVNERGVRVSSESPDDDINKSRGRIHRYIVRDEHGTRIIAQRSEDNGTHRSDANQHRTFYLPFHGSIPTHGYFARIYAYEPARDRSEIVFVVVNPMIATSDSNSQIRSCFFSIFSRDKKKKKRRLNVSSREILPLKMKIE